MKKIPCIYNAFDYFDYKFDYFLITRLKKAFKIKGFKTCLRAVRSQVQILLPRF